MKPLFRGAQKFKMTSDEKKKRPLGLGASKSKAPKLDEAAEKAAAAEETEEAQVNPGLFFDLSENEESEEADVGAIFKAAENAVGVYEDALADEDASEADLDELKDKALTLLNAVINECNRCITEGREKYDDYDDDSLGEYDENDARCLFYRYLVESIYRRETLGLTFEEIIEDYVSMIKAGKQEEHFLSIMKSIGAKIDNSEDAWFGLVELLYNLFEAVAKHYRSDNRKDLTNALERILERSRWFIRRSYESMTNKIWKLLDWMIETHSESPEIVIPLDTIGYKLYHFRTFQNGEETLAPLPIYLQIAKGHWLLRAVEHRIEANDMEEAIELMAMIRNDLSACTIDDDDDVESFIGKGELVCSLIDVCKFA